VNVVALVKEVPDPDATVTLDDDENVVVGDVPSLPSPYDENAIEAALEIKEAVGGQITVMTFGAPEAEKTLVQAMAMGADAAVLIEEPSWPLDGYSVAQVLASAVRKIGDIDIILCGREAADTSAGLVGPTVAEMLGYASVTLVSSIQAEGECLRIERPAEDGYDQMECYSPAVLSVGGQVNRPRYPTVMAMMQARRKGVEHWSLDDLGVSAEDVAGDSAGVTTLRRYLPPQSVRCEFLEAESAEEQARALIERLTEEKAF
jgi:electron transfer flavoprotein beta subunit